MSCLVIGLLVMVEWLALLLHIWELPGLSLVPQISCPERSFNVILLSPSELILG
jgi:hypothetical protein